MQHRPRILIVNADDFGLSIGVNDGIQKAFLDGIVTSASLMVRQPAASAAAEFARAHPTLSVGLHVDLGEWVHRDGEWHARYVVVDLEDPVAIRREVERQLDAFLELVGRPPTHLDSHQHVHFSEPLRRVIEEIASRLGVPVRGVDWGGFGPRVHHCGSFYGQTGTGEPLPGSISVEHLVGIIDDLRPGWTELGCHPGREGDAGTDYRAERSIEVRTLTDARVIERIATADVSLASFHDHRGVASGGERLPGLAVR